MILDCKEKLKSLAAQLSSKIFCNGKGLMASAFKVSTVYLFLKGTQNDPCGKPQSIYLNQYF